MSDNHKNPLGRWSERKTKARRDEALSSEALSSEAVVAEEPDLPAAPEESLPAQPDEPLPDIESLDKDSDYTVFMGKNVPEHLKRLALRKLWLSDPILANVDGLVDYGEDFTVSPLMGDAVKTIYRVGKGLIDEADELAEDDGGEEESEEIEAAEPAQNEDGEPVDKG